MSNFYYVTAKTGEVIDLDSSKVCACDNLEVRGSSTDIGLGYREVESWSRPAYEVALDVFFASKEKANELVKASDGDYKSKKAGMFYAEGWQQRGYLIYQKPKKHSATTVTLSVICVFLDGVWRKSKLIHLFPNSGDSEGTKRYPYKYPYRYASEFGFRSITVESNQPVTFLMCIFGYVRNPSIRIGSNTYAFDVTVPKGGYLLIDGRDCSGTLVTGDGIKTDVYLSCVRGQGEGSGKYAWERIPSGTSFARWDDTFGFDLTLFEESSAPPFKEALCT